MRRSLALGLVAPCCLAAACGSAGPNFGSLNGKTASEVLALTTTAISTERFSFHFVDQSRVGTKTTTLTGEDTAAGSYQVLSGSGSALEVEQRADKSLYVRGAAGGLEGALGLSTTAAAADAGKWISLQPADSPYKAVAAALDPHQELYAFVPTAPYTLESPREFHGRTVVGVAGKAPILAVNGTGLVATVYVPTEPPYTPVGATLTFGTGVSAGVEAVVFSRWGQRTNPPAPAGAVAYST
ncbi:MAG TPA: hypothetical protein VID75_03340 [Acidimicrobiales bacterium]|jgi:hypothetical protein